ncbi:MAG: Stp1/IreP family PP2C-type Ser/Thr phosphatase [Myxococcota bacterium]|jgi:protein phosphatase|nr:Stp1/IreP family PP2C-type Ser/Thr phosphatase [Myxococcota bacterium]
MSGIDPSEIDCASLTSMGQVRTSNQDTFDVFDADPGDRLFVVADGMGGHRGGATASRLATETIGEVFRTAKHEAADTLFEAIATANQCVHQASVDDPELRGMGTTIVCMLFGRDGRVWVAHVGDSRAYRLHREGIEQLTQDHSVVGEMVRRGLITNDEANTHPRRNEILRSVGVESEVDVDVAQVVATPGDRYVLCSDGLTGLVADDEICEVVRENPAEAAAEQLVKMANARGGHDNVTVQIIAVPAAGDEPQADAAVLASKQPRPTSARWWVGAAILLAAAAATWFVLSMVASHGSSSAPGAPGSVQEAPPTP